MSGPSGRTLANRQHCFLGIETGGTKLQVVAGTEDLKIQERRRFLIDRDRGAAGIRDQISSALDELLEQFQPVAAAIGFGGPVDWKTGRVSCSHQIEGWAGFAFEDWARKRLGCPVTVDNDANIAALGEALSGSGVGHNPVFYVTLGSGVGGGLVYNGAIFHGATPGEAEIGHVRLDRNGTIVQDRCSGWAVDLKIRQLCQRLPESVLSRLVSKHPGGEARHLAEALRQHDPGAEQIVRETADDLAFGLSHVTHLFHPEVIVLGGGLSLIGEALRAAVAASLNGYIMEAFRPGPAIRLSALGEDAVPIGCLLAARRLLNS